MDRTTTGGPLTIRDRLIAAGLWDASDPRDPETDIAAAWVLVETMIETRPDVGVGLRFQDLICGENSAYYIGYRSASEAAAAICSAALEAISG